MVLPSICWDDKSNQQISTYVNLKAGFVHDFAARGAGAASIGESLAERAYRSEGYADEP